MAAAGNPSGLHRGEGGLASVGAWGAVAVLTVGSRSWVGACVRVGGSGGGGLRGCLPQTRGVRPASAVLSSPLARPGRPGLPWPLSPPAAWCGGGCGRGRRGRCRVSAGTRLPRAGTAVPAALRAAGGRRRRSVRPWKRRVSSGASPSVLNLFYS